MQSLSVDEPPVLPIGTDVSAKYKGAFCEAKIKKINRNVRCKLTLKQGNHSLTVDDEHIVSGLLRVGSQVTVKHNGQQVEAMINKIMDQSFYTVVFDDGDEATLKRSSLCLKSGKHFAESETLDQLPLTNPEHFGNPVSLGRRRRRRQNNSDSEDDDPDEGQSGSPPEKDPDWGKIVCVEYGDKRGSKKDIWFPALIVAPTAQDATMKTVSKDEYLVRSFKDGRFYKVNRKDAREFTKEMILSKAESNSSALRSAIEKALAFLEKQELPNHWDYDLLMGNVIPQIEEEIDTSEEFDSALEDSDDEQSEEKDRFVAQLYKYMDERGTPINRAPSVGGKDLNLYKLYRIVVKMGGYNRVTNKNSWRTVYNNLGLTVINTTSGKESAAVLQLKAAYKKFLHSFDDFYRKLGCTITVNSRTSRPSRGERVREERPVAKKSVKKEKESKKEEPKEENREAKETSSSVAVEVVITRDKDSKATKDNVATKEDIKEETKPSKESKEDIKVKTEDIPSDERKRGRGRKRRDGPNDEPPGDEESMTGHSTIDDSDEDDHKNSKVDESLIKVGDGLKVKYGRGRQLKVYEAKVLKIELDTVKNKNKYFVHYSGWNSRYDEWIKKSRIVQLVRDRSPRRRSGKLKNKGETLQEVSATVPTAQSQGSVIPSLSSQNSVSSVNSNDESSRHSSQSQPAKRGRPPNSGKSGSIKDVAVKEEPKSQASQEKQSQSSPQPTQASDAKGGRRGRPPLAAKKEKLTRSKSMTDDQSTNDSFATSSIADDSMSKTDEKKINANLSSDNEVSDKNDDKDVSEDVVIEKKTVQPPELHDENTVENKMTYEEPVLPSVSPVTVKTEPTVEPSVITPIVNEVIGAVPRTSDHKEESDTKEETKAVAMKDAFDFVDEEMAKEEEPLKEQLKKKRKSKDDGKKGINKIVIPSEKTEKSREVFNEDNEVRGNGRSNSFSRKSSKKVRKTNLEVAEKTDEVPKEKPVLTEEKPLPPVLQKESPTKPEELDIKPKFKPMTETKSSHSSGESPPQREPKHKRKGRKRKEEETPTQLKKKVKPSKLELQEEDSNLEVQKLFESYSSSTPPQESDVSPVEEMKVLPQFTNDINPSQQECLSSDFLLCEEAVPASPEKVPQLDEQMDDSLPLQESPHSYHSSPTQSPEDSGNKEAKGSGGSNSELENEPIVSTKDDTNKMESFPSPTHDEDSMISRPECSKSPISPKKRRRCRVRTTSQSEGCHSKERIGCKTRGSSGRSRAERHSPLTALEHRMPFSLTPISFHNFVPESKYNFCKPLDESIDADKRINILQERLQELRKTYMNIKQEVAVLERKKKKARRKEKERKDLSNGLSNGNGRHNSNHSHNHNNNGDNTNVNHRVGPTVPPSAPLSSSSATT